MFQLKKKEKTKRKDDWFKRCTYKRNKI